MIHKKEGTLVLSFLCPCRVGKIPSLRKRITDVCDRFTEFTIPNP